MEQNFPKYIKNESDLAVYEKYLNREIAKSTPSVKIERYENNVRTEAPSGPLVYQCFLRKHIGKLIKAESLIGNRLEARIGILMEVGSDFIVIRPNKNCVTTVIDLKCVKYISIIHNNDLNML